MEITAQMTALEDEVTILKGEIKSILEEIRTAVLERESPFAPESGLPVFRRVERSEPIGEPSSQPEEAPQGAITAPATAEAVEDPLPRVVRAEPAATPLEAREGPAVAPVPSMPEAAVARPAAANPETGGGSALAPAPPMPEAAAPQLWSVSTIASLVAWVDETTSRLGPTHLHMILDLAGFAGLLPLEAEEALLKVVKLASSRKDSATVSVNDTLVALRQLEAVFQGAEDDELSLSRRRRSAGGSR